MINGLDICNYQEQPQYGKVINWPALKADVRNFRYIWIKIAEGSNLLNYPVTDTVRQIAGVQSVKFEAINLYHYYWYREMINGIWQVISAQDQANIFLAASKQAGYISKHPMTDCEDPLVGQFLDFIDTASANKAVAFARALNAHLKAYHEAITAAFGIRPDIYTGAWWWDRFGALILAYALAEATWWKDYKFILADYDGTMTLPKGITADQVIAWQFTSTPKPPVAGIATGHLVAGDACDCEVWMQTDAAFTAWAGIASVVPPAELSDHDKTGILWKAHPELWPV
jgi:hypothetical protein